MTAVSTNAGDTPVAPRNVSDAISELVLHLPDVRCAGCIASVETALSSVPGVRDARVNLTRKQATIKGFRLNADHLIDALGAAGHRAQPIDESVLAGQSDEMRSLILRTGVAGFAMMNVMLLSVAVWSGATDMTARLFHLISAAIALPAVAYSARPFFASALGALRHKRLNMDVPISLAILLAALVSLIGAIQGADRQSWFDASLALTFFLLIGRTLDHAGRSAARSAAAELAALNVPQAVLLGTEGKTVVKAATLRPDDLIFIRPGDRLPADGVVTEGQSDIDRSALTGESQPVHAGPGDNLAAGEVNLSGALTVRVVRAGSDTALSRLTELVSTAEMQRSRYQGLADRAARAYAPLVHLLAAGAFLGWWLSTGSPWQAVDVAIAVLVITCPCALGLAVPAVSVVATGRLFRKGLLLKSRSALERLSQINVVAFDKTGTLTTGDARLSADPDTKILRLAAAVASRSHHPYSRAITTAAQNRAIDLPYASDVQERPGLGLEAIVDGQTVRLGRPSWIGIPGDGVAMAWGDGNTTLFSFEEDLRPDAKKTVERLRRSGLQVAMLSGDTDMACQRIASDLGITQVESAMTPDQKAAWIRAMQQDGRNVLMVGDGLNDTGALSTAHASAALGSGLDASRAASDVILLSGKLDRLADLLTTSRASVLRMRQNIVLSAVYNLVAVPLALAGLATPFLAAIAMSLSSVTVSLNAMRRMQ